MFKKIMSVFLILIVVVIIWAGVSFGFIKGIGMPILGNEKVVIPDRDNSHINSLMEDWKEVKTYEVVKRDVDVKKIIEDIPEEKVEKKTEFEVSEIFDELDMSVVSKYIKDKGISENEFGKLYIDNLDKSNTDLKTNKGEVILVLDVFNGIMIKEKTLDDGNKYKVAVIKDPRQLEVSVVNDMGYWETVESHTKRNQALLGVNANGYTWNSIGKYGIAYGFIKWNGTVIRKPVSDEQLVGLKEDGTLLVGNEVVVEDVLYGAEYKKPMLIEGNIREGLVDKGKISRTALGQREDKSIVLLVADGGSSVDFNKGLTELELANELKEQGVVKASEMSNGNKAVMYWNGKYLGESTGYENSGVKLPNALVVKGKKIE